MVLTQRKAKEAAERARKAVSIPLWFLRNDIAVLNLMYYSKFPYHYGSYATESKFIVNKRLVKFPYHYGSYATCSRYSIPEAIIM